MDQLYNNFKQTRQFIPMNFEESMNPTNIYLQMMVLNKIMIENKPQARKFHHREALLLVITPLEKNLLFPQFLMLLVQ